MINTIYPKISIVIPSYNQGKYIERTLLSILRQDYPGLIEIIVADGGSTDDTVEVLEKYKDKIIWWSKKDNGFSDAVNKGLSIATGDICAIQSSDDYYLKDAFKKLIRGFKKHPDASLIAGRDVYLNQDNKIIGFGDQKGQISPYSILFKYTPPQHTIFFKKEYFNMVSGLRDGGGVCSEIEFWYKITHFAKGYFIPNYIAAYQYHQNQMTKTQSSKIFDALISMVDFCESSDKYKNKFKLSSTQKRELLGFWKLSFLDDHNIYTYDKIRNKDIKKKLKDYFDEKNKGSLLSKTLKYLGDGSLLVKLNRKITRTILKNKLNLYWYKI